MEKDIIRKNPQFDNHELVSFFFDKETGLIQSEIADKIAKRSLIE